MYDPIVREIEMRRLYREEESVKLCGINELGDSVIYFFFISLK